MSDLTELQQFFGKPWGNIGSLANVRDEQVPAPVGEKCMFCLVPVREGDQGLVNYAGVPQHRECGMRSALGGIGHQVDHEHYCEGELGTDAGLSYRDSSLLVWDWFVKGYRYTKEDLEVLLKAKGNDED